MTYSLYERIAIRQCDLLPILFWSCSFDQLCASELTGSLFA